MRCASVVDGAFCDVTVCPRAASRACQANHLRHLELEAREFRTEIERAEFAAVDWVDEYESAIKRKDLLGRTALDHANRKCYFDIAKCVEASVTRVAARREQLAIVKRDARLTMCPYACGYRGRADTIENHTHFICRRRPVKCVRCGIIVKEEVLVEVGDCAAERPLLALIGLT
jgi:hypothetical protein